MKKNEEFFGGRSNEEREFYIDNGFWPEQKGRLHYFLHDGRLQIEWRGEVHEQHTPERDPHEQSSSDSEDET